jgi:hypothetical protein
MLRQLFSRSNQDRTLLAARSEQGVKVESSQRNDKIEGSSTYGILIDTVSVEETNSSNVEYMFMSVSSRLKELKHSSSAGVVINSVRSHAGRIPMPLRINASLRIKRATSSSIAGFQVEENEGSSYPWKANVDIRLENAIDTPVVGIVSTDVFASKPEASI